MHELAIANSIVETVMDEVSKRGLGPVVSIGLRIGELTDVVPEALEFGFNAIVAGTAIETAKLIIERVPVSGTCRACTGSFVVRDYTFVCPSCGSIEVALDKGNELDIAYIEVNDDTPGEGSNDPKDTP